MRKSQAFIDDSMFDTFQYSQRIRIGSFLATTVSANGLLRVVPLSEIQKNKSSLLRLSTGSI